MWTRKYIVSVGLVTVALLAIAAVLWSQDGMSLAPITESEGGFWRGAEDAPVTIDVYPDFT
jgi:hypothetical protein